jgi:hypothetical protein
MTFVEVVEESEVYNFPIYAWVHFCSEISSLDFSNRARLISRASQRAASATSPRCSRPAASACRRTRTPRQVGDCWSVRVPRCSCAWYVWAPGRRHAPHPHAPPSAIGPPRRPWAAISSRSSHRPCAIP